ncbi:MAG: DNA-3-methyladenine glycosylase family protein [Acidimicrobiia bacterium]
METATLTMTQPFDMGRTLRLLEVGERADDGAWWWASQTDAGLGTVQISRSDDGVVANAWGEGATSWLERLPKLVGHGDTSNLVNIPQRAQPLMRDTRGVRLGHTGDIHAALVKAVLGQVVTTTEASRSFRVLVRTHGEPAPGPHPMRAVPTPDVLAGLTYEDLHGFGIERRRADTLVEVARRAKRLAEITTMSRNDAYTRLEAVRGIGEWTSAVVMGAAWGDKDAVPVGDYHIPNGVAWVLTGRDRGTDEDMLDLLEPFRPERRRFLTAIKLAGVRAPRYGPKTAVRKHL